MPWQNSGGGGGPWGGGGGNGGSPWGGRPGGGGPFGGGGPQPPNLDDLIRRGQDRLRGMMPGGMGSLRGLAVLGVIGVGLWLATGFYRVNPDQQGIVLRFGEYSRTTQPGLNYHLPAPIERVILPAVTRENRIEIGFRTAGSTDGARQVSQREVAEERTMLTGDQNIVDIGFTVLWRINNARDYLFNIREPEQLVRVSAESVLRERVGQTPIQVAFNEGRGRIEADSLRVLQELMDSYRAGIEIRQVQLQAVDPPGPVVDAFNEVQRARADRERLRNQADAYRNDILPRARGEAERLLQEAQAYREEVVARATGEARRFISVLDAYTVSPDVTSRRLYLETMEQVLRSSQKVLLDRAEGGNGPGVVPYLPLPAIVQRPAQPPAQSQPQSTETR
ncbi:MAG: FtsH protease activity modulator HflK [Alphaproteobacteria bacterium]|nr:FtsH protease activity modulator HflK [Alphaproteobacteria bacterium]